MASKKKAVKAQRPTLHLKGWNPKVLKCVKCGVALDKVTWTKDQFYWDFAPENCAKAKL